MARAAIDDFLKRRLEAHKRESDREIKSHEDRLRRETDLTLKAFEQKGQDALAEQNHRRDHRLERR